MLLAVADMVCVPAQNADAVVINSILEGRGYVAKGALVEHSVLSGNFRVDRSVFGLPVVLSGPLTH